MKGRWILAGCVLWLLASGCWWSSTSPLTTHSQAMIYGADDRKDVFEHPDPKLQALAAAVAMSVANTNITIDPQTGQATLVEKTFTDHIRTSARYGQKPLCEDEPFRLDPQAGSCTAFLVGPRLMVTAGHCVSSSDPVAWCAGRSVVFGYHRAKDGKPNALTKDDVYRCQQVLVRKLTARPPIVDIASFTLDRDVVGRTPLPIDNAPQLKPDHKLALIGHPHGILMKIAAGGKVVDARTTDLDYFVTNLDTYPGNSGSPVFSLESYKVIGVHVRGARPVFVVDTAKDCNRSSVREEDKGTQSATYIVHAQERKCKANTDCDPDEACLEERCRPRRPDLQVTALTFSQAKPLLGTPLNINFTVTNAGQSAVRSTFYIGLWHSNNATINPTGGADKQLAVQKLAPLGPGESIQGSFTIQLTPPQLTPGPQYIGAYVDDRTNEHATSNAGLVAEVSELNNATAKALEVQACDATCTQEKARRCDGERILECQKNTNGCLSWELAEFCSKPRLCNAGKCELTCQHTCEFVDERKCFATDAKLCQVQPNGCRAWELVQTCSQNQTCKAGKCADNPTPKAALGRPCTSPEGCLSGRCAGNTGKTICKQSCQTHSECKSAPGLPYCQNQLCEATPTGKCLTPSDCQVSGSTCIDNACIPPKGCGCQVTHRPDAPIPTSLILLLLGAFYLRCRRT